MSVDDWPSGAIQFCWRPMYIAMPKARELVYYSRMEKLFLAFGQTITPIHTG